MSYSLRDLILYSILSIEEEGQICTFERLVKECFDLFPDAFSLSRYPQWPDSLKLDRSLRTLRNKGLIVGNPNTRYSLTDFGRKIAKNVEAGLRRQPSQELDIGPSSRSPELRYLKEIRRSELFRKYSQAGPTFEFDEMELRGVMGCTMETPRRILRQNIQLAINLAEESGDHELLNFLELCRRRVQK